MAILSAFALGACSQNNQNKKSDLQRDNLKGSIKSLVTIATIIKDSSKEEIKDSALYDKDGYLTENYKSVSGIQTVKFKTVYKYNSKENKTEGVTYDDKNTIFSKDSLTYDNNGNCLEHGFYDIDPPKLYFKEVFEYNANNKPIKLSMYRRKRIYMTADYNYDSTGNIVSKIGKSYEQGVIVNEATIKHNEYGDESESTDGYVYKYEYDKTGNWIKKTRYFENALSEMLLRGTYTRKVYYY